MSKARQLAELGNVYDDGALGNRNLIINGAMQVAQRGTSVTASGTGAYSSLDRFRFQTNLNTNSVISQESDAPTGFEYSFKLAVGTGATPSSSDFGRLYYRVEGYESNQLSLGSASSKAVTLSFWVKSSVTGTYGVQLAGDGLGAYIASYSVSSASTWEYKTITIPAGIWTTYNGSTTNGTGFQVAFDLGEGPSRSTSTGYNASWSGGNMGLTSGTKILATSSATWQITGVQLEVGDTATPFEHRSFGQDLALCQRYFYNWRQDLAGVNSHGSFIIGMFQTTRGFFSIDTPVPMRAVPSIGISGSLVLKTPDLGDAGIVTSLLLYTWDKNFSRFSVDTAITGGTANVYRTLVTGGSVNDGLQLDAEL